MKISKKANSEYLQLGVAYIVVSIVLFITLGYLGASAKEFMGVGRFFSLVLLIFGLVKIYKYHQFKQEKEAFFEIKNGKIIYDDKEYPLFKGYLTVEFKEEDEFYKVSLWLEKDKNTVQIFEDVVFNKDEMHSFLTLIKPYRKTDICLLENKENLEVNEEKTNTEFKKDELKENQKLENGDLITLFNKGLMVEKREILYSEILYFLANITVINEKRYVDIDIVLKNGTEIKARINSYDDQAKAFYAKHFFELKGDISSKDDYPCYKYNFWVAFVILILIVAGFSGELGWIAVIATLFLATIYFASLIDFFYHKNICKKVQDIIEERRAYDKMH